MSSRPGDAASHQSSFGFANHVDSSNLVGSLFFDPFLGDLKLKMLGSLLF